MIEVSAWVTSCCARMLEDLQGSRIRREETMALRCTTNEQWRPPHRIEDVTRTVEPTQQKKEAVSEEEEVHSLFTFFV